MSSTRIKITAQNVLDLMPIVADRGWKQSFHGIRDQYGYCPLCALANVIVGTIEKNDAFVCASALLNGEFAESEKVAILEIVDAADQAEHDLRRKLMNVLMMPTNNDR